jgi:ferredoxin-NADP reductase/predicted pyridoxine 5'-phosphate oxidase superfamily flavin-nucleotide-binding protein
MARAFADISFTPGVKAAQSRYGSRAANRGFEAGEVPKEVLTEREREFIAERDGFYQASVGETGWPYVQFRGGPPGFLKVLDERTIGYADFRGNRQYITTGNLATNDRVALILMDYANRRRLKIWARARIVHAEDDAALLRRLEAPHYRAAVERAIVLRIEAFDWNCPQHITPRYTQAEIATLAHATPGATAASALGSGPLDLVVSGLRQLTPRIRHFELRAVDGGPLPAWRPGAHLLLPVRTAVGTESRAFSLVGDPRDREVYEIAVMQKPEGRGGSLALHRDYALGTALRCDRPRNAFALHRDERPSILIAGGIGITPLRAMALDLIADNRRFELHYAARSPREMAFREDLQRRLGPRLKTYFSGGDGSRRLDLAGILTEAPADAVIYVCGPAGLMQEVQSKATALGRGGDSVRSERFAATVNAPDDRPLEVILARSGRALSVPAGQTVLEALEQAGLAPPSLCRTGACGTCAVKVLEGRPEHRDSALTAAEQNSAGLMCVCVSRAMTDRLVLDL